VGDDHGFKRLMFHYRFVQGGDSVPAELRSGMKELPIDGRNTRQEFFHSWEVYGFTIDPGDRIEHWFEVWDNDGVHGSKSARSTPQVFAAPTLKELAKQEEQQSEAIKNSLKENIKEAQDLQKELDKLRRELLEKKEVNWQDKQKLENVMQRQQQLQQEIEKSTEQLRQSPTTTARIQAK
jgi:regulator of replication initiation timing